MRAWLASRPGAAELVDTVLPRVVRAMPEPTVDVEGALAAVRARMLTVSPGGARRTSDGAGRQRRRPWFSDARGFAAAAAVLLAAGLGAREVVRRGSGAAPAASSSRVFETATGVRDSVLLSDGSRVVLAPGSRLTVPASFDSARTVDLEGAAYFEVRHDEAHPFTVRSRGAEVRDIGTAFSVTTDATGSVSVAVTEGVVAMRSIASPASRAVELKAGDRGVLRASLLPGASSSNALPLDTSDTADPAGPDGANLVHVTRGTVTADDMAWTRGDLSYRDAPLSVVQADLRRWYGINLVVTDSLLLRRTLTISFRGDSAAGALRKVALTLGAETVARGDTVQLRRASGAPTFQR